MCWHSSVWISEPSLPEHLEWGFYASTYLALLSFVAFPSGGSTHSAGAPIEPSQAQNITSTECRPMIGQEVTAQDDWWEWPFRKNPAWFLSLSEVDKKPSDCHCGEVTMIQSPGWRI